MQHRSSAHGRSQNSSSSRPKGEWGGRHGREGAGAWTAAGGATGVFQDLATRAVVTPILLAVVPSSVAPRRPAVAFAEVEGAKREVTPVTWRGVAGDRVPTSPGVASIASAVTQSHAACALPSPFPTAASAAAPRPSAALPPTSTAAAPPPSTAAPLLPSPPPWSDPVLLPTSGETTPNARSTPRAEL
eukprot:scaffold477_cov73-Isochrysis_galbana.AAC.3